MSWNDNDIDQLFRGATPPEAPAFQEDFWNEMEALLPVQKRRKAAFWWIGGSATLVILVGISLFWWNSSTQVAAPSSNSSALTHVPAHESANAQTTENSSVDAVQTTASVTPIQSNESGSQAISHPIKPINDQKPGVKNQIVDQTTELAENNAINTTEQTVATERPAYVFDKLQSLKVVAKPTLTVDSPNLPQFYPDFDQPKAERFYAQVGVGIGQSYQQKVQGASNFVHSYVLGGGLYKRIDHMVLSFGLNARVDFSQNIVNTTYPEATTTHQIDTKYSQLYTFETPLSIGFQFGRNTFGATVTPGFQTAFTGKETEILNDVTVRSERAAGTVSNGKTLTMEVGVNYWRTIAPNWYVGAAVNIDAIRPFNPANFAGQQRLLPLNGQLTLRRTF